MKKHLKKNNIIREKGIDTINDFINVKLIEADNAIKNGAEFYTREEVDKILTMITKQNIHT